MLLQTSKSSWLYPIHGSQVHLCVAQRPVQVKSGHSSLTFSWQTKTALVNLIFQWGRTVWMFSVFLLVPRLSVNSGIPGTLRAGVSLRFTPSRGIRIPTFPALWKNISPKNFRKSLFWLSRQSGPIRKWAAGAWGSLSDSICRQDRESSWQWWGSAHFLLFLQVVHPHQMVHSAFRMCLPTSLRPLWNALTDTVRGVFLWCL